MDLEKIINKEIDKNNGVLRLKPNYVARPLYPAGGRLGLDKIYINGKGWISERWLGSAVNVLGSRDEGLSELSLGLENIKTYFREALSMLPERLLGKSYSKMHNNRFGVLTKILDPGIQIPLHIHAGEPYARIFWSSNPKEEAYHYLDHPCKGPTPYIHLGFHTDVTESEVLELLKRWSDDKILDLSPAYRCNIGEGFHVFAGVVHAPCTLLTLEVQEESDVGTILQAKVYDRIISKEQYLLNGPISEEEVLKLIDWDVCRDPKFYRKYHIVPEIRVSNREFTERWIFNPKISRKFSGIELRIAPNVKLNMSRKGAFLLFAWRGKGKINGLEIVGGDPYRDEVFVSYEAAKDHVIVNEGKEELVLYEIFGPDVYV
jgi:hypothetical protein